MRAPAKPRRGVFVLVNGGGLAAFQLHGDEAPLIDLPPLLGRAVMQPRGVGGGSIGGSEAVCERGGKQLQPRGPFLTLVLVACASPVPRE